MLDDIHRFAVVCIACGKLPQQARSKKVLGEQLKTGKEIYHYCSNCDHTWTADPATRGHLARQLGVNDWR